MKTSSKSWLPSRTRMAVSRRRFLGSVAAGAGATVLLACGGEGETGLKFDDASSSREPGTVWNTRNDWKLADETKEAVRGGIYPGHVLSEMTGNFDAMTFVGSEIPYAAHVYEQLVVFKRGPGIDPSSQAANLPVGALAESWEFADEGTTVTFTLRPGVKFHNVAPVNGRVMDIEDWKTSQERHLQINPFRDFLGDVLDKTEYPDARHMVWKLKHAYAPIFQRAPHDNWGYLVMPKELNANPDVARTNAIGTGFKILDKHQPAITLEYRKNAEYWGGDPFIERWHTPIIPEHANRYAQFVTGGIMDFAPTAREVLALAKDVPNAVIVADPPEQDRAARYLFGVLNPDGQPTVDPRVRIAIRRSVDFKSIGEFLGGKTAFETAGVPIEILPMTHVPQDPTYWLNPEKGELGNLSENFLYGPEEAKKLTAATGHSGLVPLTIAVQLARGEIPEYDQLVVDSLKASNTFDVKPILSATSVEQNKYRLERDFDGMVWIGGSNIEIDYLLARNYTTVAARDGKTAYGHVKTEAFLKAQRRELDFEKRMKIIRDLQLWFAEWFPSIPAQHLSTRYRFRWPWLHNSNWGGSESPPTGRPHWGSHLNWLDADMPRRNG
ncbi:MAG: hypothetical protein GEU75_06805 [Dehalococcoidia bacterium]|nr:hypothetical protein [Dehalococcoidia bacterium]